MVVLAAEDLAPIFRYKDQVRVQFENAVPAVANIVWVAHWPMVSWRHATPASLQIRADAKWRTAAPDAPLCRKLPLRLQQGAGVAKGMLRGR